MGGRMRVRAAGAAFDVDAVVFDKDGTLIDLEAYWLEPARIWVEDAAAGDPVLSGALGRHLGLSPHGLVAHGLLATATLPALVDATARILVASGVEEAIAVQRAASARERAAEVAESQPLIPLGPVNAALERLARAGVKLALLTTDHGRPTHKALIQLGIAQLFDAVVTADDGLPAKPHPGALEGVASRLGTAVERTLMVGDSRSDALTARSAGAGGFVLVAGQGNLDRLDADAVVSSIGELEVDEPPADRA